jgi:DnaJ-class molecular chaperone
MLRTKRHIRECHEILGVEKDTPKDEIKKAFKRIIMLHHPDRKEEHEKAAYEEASKIYIEAYKTLTDDEFMQTVRDFESGKLGKNRECYCGSERKHKQCCEKAK